MMKTYLLSLVGILACPFLFSQILSVNSGSSVSIPSNSSITLDGLEISPSSTYVISGDNDVSRSATAETAGSNSSVSRVYSSSALLSGFTGTLTFSYLEGELNDIEEGDLVLELQADDVSGNHGGGGGGGWYGGGGAVNKDAGGGGGSSYTHPNRCDSVVHTKGVQTGHGKLIITLNSAE
jgi:hypothetical protein